MRIVVRTGHKQLFLVDLSLSVKDISNYFFLISMTTYCLPQRHVGDSHSKDGSSSCQNFNIKFDKGCILVNSCNLLVSFLVHVFVQRHGYFQSLFIYRAAKTCIRHSHLYRERERYTSNKSRSSDV